MTDQERERIVSNDYADLIVEYSGDLGIIESFQDATFRDIDFISGIIHVPVSQITNQIIFEQGYAAMPKCYGIISSASLEASGVNRIRNISSTPLRGQGVLVGIIDTGIDYTNPIFQYPDKTSKIVSLWDQTIESNNYPENIYYGTEYTQDQITQAINSGNPLALIPSTDEIGHGTMVAGIAAGREDPENNFSGVVPDAELVIVKLKTAKPYLKDFFMIPPDAVCYQENDILFGLRYLADMAKKLSRPMAICLALGSSQGAHDGRDFLSILLSYYSSVQGTAYVVAAGNEGNSKRHYYGVVDPTVGYNTVEVEVGPQEQGFSMEIWGKSPNIFSVEIISPLGELIPRIPARLDRNKEVSFVFDQTRIYIDYQMVEGQTGEQLILVRLKSPTPGIWTFRVYGRGDLTLDFHCWLPMEPFISPNTFFVKPNPYTTVLSLGNAVLPITVTAYNYTNQSLYLNASRGFSRVEVVTPQLAAPGVEILSPSMNQRYTRVTGTSPAAAHTTGLAAMLLEWGIVRGNARRMNTIEIRKYMIRGAKRASGTIYPNREWGYGIVDIFNVFDVLR